MSSPHKLAYTVLRTAQHQGVATLYFDGHRFSVRSRGRLDYAQLVGVYDHKANLDSIREDIEHTLGDRPFPQVRQPVGTAQTADQMADRVRQTLIKSRTSTASLFVRPVPGGWVCRTSSKVRAKGLDGEVFVRRFCLETWDRTDAKKIIESALRSRV